MEWLLEIALVGLLAATLFHAVRLERVLGVLKRDRAELQELIHSFNDSTHQAELGVEKLRGAAEGAGRHLSGQVNAAAQLKDDLVLLTERGERLADRIDALVRAGRPLSVEAPRLTVVSSTDHTAPRVRSQAERDLLKALRMAR